MSVARVILPSPPTAPPGPGPGQNTIRTAILLKKSFSNLCVAFSVHAVDVIVATIVAPRDGAGMVRAFSYFENG